MTVDDALNRRQADTGTLKILAAMGPLERHEQFVFISHIESDSIIADATADLAIQVLGQKLDISARLAAGKLPGVAENGVEGVTLSLIFEDGMGFPEDGIKDRPDPFSSF